MESTENGICSLSRIEELINKKMTFTTVTPKQIDNSGPKAFKQVRIPQKNDTIMQVHQSRLRDIS